MSGTVYDIVKTGIFLFTAYNYRRFLMNITFYQKEDGSEPAKEFLLSLEPNMRAKVARTVDQLRAKGHNLRAPASKNLGDGIFELRTILGNNTTRILYFFFIGNTAVLTNGFIKKTQKTPMHELERAKRYRDDYKRRNP